MYLTFPSFSITKDIPKNRDLKVPIGHLTEDDRGLLNFNCDGIPFQEKQLDNFATQLSFLDNMLKSTIAGNDHKHLDQLFKGCDMTHTQRKEAYSKLQHALGCNFACNKNSNYGNGTDTSNPNYSDKDDNNETNDDARKLNLIMNELPDCYLCEGSPDEMMMDALEE